MDVEIFATEIRKTGFVLENQIATELKRNAWTVISNKYYEDDFEGTVREMDLLAYKVSKIKHINVYTTLLISCKKNESNVWALLARDINLKDPNSDWWPLHSWTNYKPLNYELSQPGKSREYHDDVQKFGVKEALSIPDVEVFTFQEMKKKGGAPQNDTNMFKAVTSLMKAQAYELSALPKRKKATSVYQFNLLSVIDSDLVRLKFSGEKIDAELINSEHYIARYIVNKKESCSRVRFMKASFFKDALAEYNQLHLANCFWFEQTINSFFEEAVKDWQRIQVLIDEFRSELKWSLLYRMECQFNQNFEKNDLYLYWRAEEDCLDVTLSADGEIFEFLNNDTESITTVANALKKIYRYSGKFIFAKCDIPF